MGNTLATIDKNTIQVSVEVALFREGDYIVAYCPAFQLSSFGDNEKDAHEAFDEALEIFFEETSSKGTLEKVLLDLGWGLRKFPDLEYFPPVKLRHQYPESIISKFDELVSIPV